MPAQVTGEKIGIITAKNRLPRRNCTLTVKTAENSTESAFALSVVVHRLAGIRPRPIKKTDGTMFEQVEK
jgi:hypothetical protein